MVKVSEFERHIENLKKDNDILRERLHELKIDTQDNDSKDVNEQDKYQDEEIMEMNKKIGVLNKDY